MPTTNYRPIPELTPNNLRKFHSRVDRSGGPDSCWIWMGAKNSRGYGYFVPQGRINIGAHRIAFRIQHGRDPFPNACHACDTPSCVNPDHLFEGTSRQNSEDMVRKGRSATGDRAGARLYPERMTRGEAHPKAKLTNDQVAAIREQYESGQHSSLTLGHAYSLDSSTILDIIHRRTWKHV